MALFSYLVRMIVGLLGLKPIVLLRSVFTEAVLFREVSVFFLWRSLQAWAVVVPRAPWLVYRGP